MIEQEWFSAAQVATKLGIKWRTVMLWVQQGRLPKPQKFGKSARWSVATIEQIAAQGVPSMKELAADQVEGMLVSCPDCGHQFRVLTHRPDTTSTRSKPKASTKAKAKATKRAQLRSRSAGRS